MSGWDVWRALYQKGVDAPVIVPPQGETARTSILTAVAAATVR